MPESRYYQDIIEGWEDSPGYQEHALVWILAKIADELRGIKDKLGDS